MRDTRQPLPVVAGPTASGKTVLAVALAQRLNGEVVSADSMQIYQELSVGTARPSIEEMQGVPHHLIGFLPLSELYNVARYVEDAHRVITEIHERDHLPILCGGTGLYIQSLIENLNFIPQEHSSELRESIRNALEKRVKEEGGETLLAELKDIDPETAARLHPNDTGRIIRAWEVYQTTGQTMSEQIRQSRLTPTPYNSCLIVLDCHERQMLYERINRRVDIMMNNGLLEEASRLQSVPHTATVVQGNWI